MVKKLMVILTLIGMSGFSGLFGSGSMGRGSSQQDIQLNASCGAIIGSAGAIAYNEFPEKKVQAWAEKHGYTTCARMAENKAFNFACMYGAMYVTSFALAKALRGFPIYSGRDVVTIYGAGAIGLGVGIQFGDKPVFNFNLFGVKV